MAFKIPNFSKQMGGSPFAMKSPLNGPYEEALKRDPNLASYIAERKKHEKGTPEYNAAQNKINAAYKKGPTNRSETKTEESNESSSSNESTAADEAPKSDDKKEHKPAEGVKVKSRKEKRAAKRVARLSKKNKKKGLRTMIHYEK